MCVFVFERRRLSATQLRRGPLIPMLAYVSIASHGHRRVVTLADRRPHSFRPPSGLHQSVLLFNNSPDTCRLYIHSHAHRISRRMPLDLRIHMLFLWPETESIQHLLQLNIKKPENYSSIHMPSFYLLIV